MKNHKQHNFENYQDFDRQSRPILSEYFSRLSTSISNIYNQLSLWFKQLPKWGQAVVILSSIIVGIKLLETIFRLIYLSITLLIIGGGIYLAYKIFIANTSSSEENTK